MGFCGPKFTWTRGVHASTFKKAKLDRAFCKVEWNVLFPNSMVTHLLWIGSDHSSILVNFAHNSRLQGQKPFRFQAAWLTFPSFKSMVESVWSRETSSVDNNRAMASVLGDWIRNIFGDIYKRKRRLLVRIEGDQRTRDFNYETKLIKLDIKLKLSWRRFWFRKSCFGSKNIMKSGSILGIEIQSIIMLQQWSAELGIKLGLLGLIQVTGCWIMAS